MWCYHFSENETKLLRLERTNRELERSLQVLKQSSVRISAEVEKTNKKLTAQIHADKKEIARLKEVSFYTHANSCTYCLILHFLLCSCLHLYLFATLQLYMNECCSLMLQELRKERNQHARLSRISSTSDEQDLQETRYIIQ